MKQIVEHDQVVKSLINLRDELLQLALSGSFHINPREVSEKINSCLYSKYPNNIKKANS